MPGKMLTSSCWRRRAMRLSRSSSLTWRVRRRSSEKSLWRNSPRVRGRDMKTPERNFGDYTRDGGLRTRLSGFDTMAEACSPKADALSSMHVAVAAGFFTGVGGAAEIGDDGF